MRRSPARINDVGVHDRITHLRPVPAGVHPDCATNRSRDTDRLETRESVADRRAATTGSFAAAPAITTVSSTTLMAA